jgi:hypothetical protein
MANFLFRNQGGSPIRINPINYRTIGGTTIGDVSLLDNTALRDLDIFRMTIQQPTPAHRFQRIVFDRYEYDVATMTATETYVLQDMTKAAALDQGLQTIRTTILAARAAGFKWDGPKVNSRGDAITTEKGGVVCNSNNKIDLLLLIQNFEAGVIVEHMWPLDTDIFIPLNSLDDAKALLSDGTVYEVNLMAQERHCSNELRDVHDDVNLTVADLALKVEDCLAGIRANTYTYVEPV